MTSIAATPGDQLHRLTRATQHMQKATKRAISLQSLQAFTTVGLEEGLSLTEITAKLGARPSTVSRQLLDLSDHDRFGGDGYGLIEVLKQPLDFSANSYVLTDKGRVLFDEVASIISGSVQS